MAVAAEWGPTHPPSFSAAVSEAAHARPERDLLPVEKSAGVAIKPLVYGRRSKRGNEMTKKVLLGLMLVLGVGALSAAPALAHTPQFWTDKTETLKLRSVTSTPSKLQPDALEFSNNGPLETVIKTIATKKEGSEEKTVLCTEVEFGTTVVVNSPEGEKNHEDELAMPFGIAEGDACEEGKSGAAVPTYFDTTAVGVVPATVTFSGGPEPTAIIATVHKLKLSENIGSAFCTLSLEGAKGEVHNSSGPFVEESTPNLNVQFTKAALSGSCVEGPITRKFTGTFTANYFLETMSTLTDTAWIN
jgi:hypothetical protein